MTDDSANQTMLSGESALDAYACTLDGLTAIAQDGRTAPLDKCGWAEVAPCGCMSGITTAVNPDEVIHTTDAAQRAMSGSASEAQRDKRNGNRMVLVLMEDYRPGILEIFQRDCSHDPKWGVRKPTRTLGGVTFTRLSERRWQAEGGWEVEKLGRWWYLNRNAHSGERMMYLADRLPEALARAASQITLSAERSTAGGA